jgi:hypothetical protein
MSVCSDDAAVGVDTHAVVDDCESASLCLAPPPPSKNNKWRMLFDATLFDAVMP